MINKTQAREIIEVEIIDNLPDCQLLEELTKEFNSCFAFYYQSKKYIEQRNDDDMYIGQGPIIICKTSGNIFKTGSAYSIEHYVHVFENCGDPLAEPTVAISIIGCNEGANAVKAIKYIKSSCSIGLYEAKSKIDQVLDGNIINIYLPSIELAKQAKDELVSFGFDTKQLWSNQC